MSDQPIDQAGSTIPERQPKPGEHLWTLTKDGARMRCEMRHQRGAGWEVQLFRDGVVIYGRCWLMKEDALGQAAAHRRDYEAEGWQP